MLLQQFTSEYKNIQSIIQMIYITQISEIKIHYITAEDNTKHNWKEYADTKLSEYSSSCKPGSCEYKSAKPKLLAARAENKGTQSLG